MNTSEGHKAISAEDERARAWTFQPRHLRNSVIKGDLVVCGCGAVGEVRIERVLWFFERVRIYWYESEAGADLVRARIPSEDARVAPLDHGDAS